MPGAALLTKKRNKSRWMKKMLRSICSVTWTLPLDGATVAFVVTYRYEEVMFSSVFTCLRVEYTTGNTVSVAEDKLKENKLDTCLGNMSSR